MTYKKKYLLIMLVIPVILVSFWFFYPFDRNNLPPKTPIKIARHITGLNIPDEVGFDLFNRNENDFNGDYVDEIVISLTVDQTQILQAEWREKGYGEEPLPKEDPKFSTGEPGLISKYTSPSDQCWNRHTHTDAYDSVSILDLTNNRLIIYDSSS